MEINNSARDLLTSLILLMHGMCTDEGVCSREMDVWLLHMLSELNVDQSDNERIIAICYSHDCNPNQLIESIKNRVRTQKEEAFCKKAIYDFTNLPLSHMNDDVRMIFRAIQVSAETHLHWK